MESADVSDNKVFSPSSLATSNRLQKELSRLTIPIFKRSDDFKELPNDVSEREPASPFLEKDQYDHRLQQHTHQSTFYFHNTPVGDDISLERVNFNLAWSELVLPVFVCTVVVIGILTVGALLFLWFKNLVSESRKTTLISPIKIEKGKKSFRMSEYEAQPEDETVANNSPSVQAEDINQAEETGESREILPNELTPKDCTSPTLDRKIHKTNTSDNLSVAYSQHSLRRAQAKTSLNNVSIINTSPNAFSSPSPTIKSAGKKFSFNQTSFYEQQQQLLQFKGSFSGNAEDNEESAVECPISKISVLKGDVCCVQPPQRLSESPLFDTGRVPGSSSKIHFESHGVKPKSVSESLSDDKENMMKCSPMDHVPSRGVKTLRGSHPFTGVESSDIQMLSSRKVLTQSPIFFGSDQNSPNYYDSSSSPTLIPSLTPSSVSSATTTYTTPNAAMNSCSSSSSLNRFTFSPKIVNELSQTESPQVTANHPSSANGKFGNSYFRFPDVDSFTPPTSAQTAILNNKGTVFKIPSLVTSWIPSLDTPSSEPTAPQKSTDSHADGMERLKEPEEETMATDQLDGIESNECNTRSRESAKVLIPDSITSTSRATRRVRLKSISLDSEGARLVEENLTTSIPVEELVEIAANQPHHSVSDNQFQSTMQSEIMDSIDGNSCRKQRNIFNLTLNLNDKDESLTVDDDYKFNEFYFEYYDYDDDEDEEYDLECGSVASRKSQHSQIQTPRTPTITQTRKKASSLDSDQSLNYLLPQPVRTHSAMEKVEHRTNTRNVVHHSTSLNTHTSSLSVPTTPKRQPYRLQQQQQHSKYKPNRYMGENATTSNNSPASERHLLCGFQQRLGSFEENTDSSNTNMDDHKYIGGSKGNLSNLTLVKDHTLSKSNANLKTLPEITPVCEFTEPNNEQLIVEKPPTQTLNKSRSSILQRRGSNHSLVLNLEAASGDSGLTKGLSASNYSLSNYKGSHLSLAGSSYNLQQHQTHHQGPNKPSGQTVQIKKNLLQRRGSNTSLILNLQGSSNSLNRYNSHNSLNMHNQQNVRPAKKGLLERRNSNTSLTLINVQNRALSVSNCNLPGSICSLNSMATYQTQNDGLMLEEDEHQLASNNGQTKCREHSATCTGNEPHLSPNCQQHGGRRKFLSSDSLHNITNTRASCCCKQKETDINNTNMCYHQTQINSHSDSMEDYKQNETSRSNECSCVSNMNGKGSEKRGIAANDMFKYKTTVTSTASTNNLTQFTCCDCCCCNCADALAGGVNTMSISNTNVRKITTKPLSPQTTSEDFKIYLANIQFLQNASNMLSATYMKNLHAIFKKSYGCYDKNKDDNVLPGANNDVKLTNLSIIPNIPNTADGTEACAAGKRSENEELISEEMQKQMTLKIHQEFWDLPSNYQEKPLVFGSQSKNRYKTILPNEHSRVILEIEPGMSAEPYINANYIKGPDYTNNSYIATQGPMVNTIYEFWLMVHQNVMKSTAHNISKLCSVEQKIIMLTDFVENNRQKCSVYFPLEINESVVFSNLANISVDTVLSATESILTELKDNSETKICKAADPSINFNYFLITNVAICRKNGYTMRELFVVHSYQNPVEQQEIRVAYTVHHYWFPDWPDHRSPEDIDVLLDMSLDILDNNCMKDFSKEPTNERIRSLPIIHCSAGIGRTGCLLAILNGLSQIRSSLNPNKSPCVVKGTEASGDKTKFPLVPTENQTLLSQSTINEQASVDVLGIVCNLRLQRGGMVQNSEQYELIHRALCLYMQKHNLQK
ncbi:uncharacterized protein LOC129749731 [Uranotaenia lowii]|uniref:uncharacterized protein LOC129749731 n=1 Tax=Uranotaenia lowii TaxID=190385 RepID=UPI00247A930D|nr:uncharacterized protein LOC129749731 [Uranotaenia lowii]